jgi:hypothetical protein
MLAVLALAPLPAACGSDQGGSGSARRLLERAAQKTAKSADVKVEFAATLKGVDELEGPLKLTLEGPFRSNGAATLPDLDWRLRGEAGGKRLDARLVTIPDNVFVEYRGTAYEVGEQLIERLNQRLREGRTDPRELRGLGFDASRWIEDPEVSDAEVGGVPTRRVSGELDVRALLEGLDKLFRSPAVSGQLPPGATPPRIPQDVADKVEDAVKDARTETDVGRDDGIMRRNLVELRFEIPEDQRSRLNGLEGGEIKMLFEQSDVNGAQHVTPPSGARPIEELLGTLGIPPELFLAPGFR